MRLDQADQYDLSGSWSSKLQQIVSLSRFQKNLISAVLEVWANPRPFLELVLLANLAEKGLAMLLDTSWYNEDTLVPESIPAPEEKNQRDEPETLKLQIFQMQVTAST